MDALFRRIPAGVGTGGPYLFGGKELRRLLAEGSPYLATRGWATPGDIEHTEAGGCLPDAEPDYVSQRALKRGGDQCGTLGSGNHFLEVQVVEEVVDEAAARTMGLEQGRRVRDDPFRLARAGLPGVRRRPAAAPQSAGQVRHRAARPAVGLCPGPQPRGAGVSRRDACAANYAWANRQLLMWQTREIFAEFFGRTWESLQMNLVYDVAHNIAKMEEHEIEGRRRLVCVHRKGATRAFPAGHPEVPEQYRQIGQPVIIPGDMGRASWVLVGQPGSMERTFGTTCHGAGRVMSRTAAIQHAQGRRIDRELAEQGHHRQVPKLEGAGRGAAGRL